MININKKRILFLFSLLFLITTKVALSASSDVNIKLEVLYEAPPDSGGGIIGDVIGPSFNFNISSVSNIINLNASRPVKYVLSLGETESLEMGIIMSGNLFSISHEIIVPGLTPGKNYFYKLQLIDEGNNTRESPINILSVLEEPEIPLPLPNVIGLGANFSESGINIFWQLPVLPSGAFIRLLRSDRFFPLDKDDGIPFFEGIRTSYFDTDNLNEGSRYYYTVFVCDSSGRCSSGSSVSVLYSFEDDDEDFTAPELIPGDLPSGDLDAVPKILIIEDEEEVLPSNNTFYVKETSNIKIASDSDIPKDDISAVIVSIKKAGDPDSREFTYLLNYDDSNDRYETSYFNLPEDGEYEISVKYFDLNKKLIKTEKSVIFARKDTIKKDVFPDDFVGGIKDVASSKGGRRATGVAGTVGILAGLALLIMQSILSTATMTVTSISDLSLLLWRLLGILFGKQKKKGRPWGTVFDSVTKRPLDPAYVVVNKDSGEEVADAITDLDGRYGFLVPSGKYKLKASKTNYAFPTSVLANKNNDELYENIYHGETVDITEGEVVAKNIALDPVGFDWNEFEKNKKNLFRIYSDRERTWAKLFNGLYIFGLLSAVFATIFDPRPINIAFLLIYAVFIFYNSLGSGIKKAVSIKNSKTGDPIPFAIIKVFFADLENQAKTAVADHLGRFYFLVGPGRYYITINEKQSDGSYKEVHKTPPMQLDTGVLTEDIII